LGVLQVCVDRRDDDTCFDGDEVDADQRDADPGVDDNSLVEHAVEDVDETGAAGCTFNGHRALLVLISTQRFGGASASRAAVPGPEPASSVPRFRPTAPGGPATDDGRTSTSRARSAAPYRSNRLAGESGS